PAGNGRSGVGSHPHLGKNLLGRSDVLSVGGRRDTAPDEKQKGTGARASRHPRGWGRYSKELGPFGGFPSGRPGESNPRAAEAIRVNERQAGARRSGRFMGGPWRAFRWARIEI